MKRILCFGDSNTFGFMPATQNRYSKNERWSGLLANYLDTDFEVIEEGRNNRTGFIDNPAGTEYIGIKYLPIYIKDKNIDICIISLGTNDSQFCYNLTANIIEQGLTTIIKTLKTLNNKMEIIIVPTVNYDENILNGFFSIMFNKKSIEINNKTFNTYKDFANKNNCLYFDFNKYAKPSIEDGLHYSKESHQIIAKELSKFIKENS